MNFVHVIFMEYLHQGGSGKNKFWICKECYQYVMPLHEKITFCCKTAIKVLRVQRAGKLKFQPYDVFTSELQASSDRPVRCIFESVHLPGKLFQYPSDLQAEQEDHGIVDVSCHLPAQPSYTIYSVDISNFKSSARCAPWSVQNNFNCSPYAQICDMHYILAAL